MEFSERLRYLMECEELNQKQLAAALHMASSTISNYIQGNREPDFETMIRIADYFHVSIDSLVGREENFPTASGEEELVRLYRRAAPAQKELLLRTARLLGEYRVARITPAVESGFPAQN